MPWPDAYSINELEASTLVCFRRVAAICGQPKNSQPNALHRGDQSYRSLSCLLVVWFEVTKPASPSLGAWANDNLRKVHLPERFSSRRSFLAVRNSGLTAHVSLSVDRRVDIRNPLDEKSCSSAFMILERTNRLVFPATTGSCYLDEGLEKARSQKLEARYR